MVSMKFKVFVIKSAQSSIISSSFFGSNNSDSGKVSIFNHLAAFSFKLIRLRAKEWCQAAYGLNGILSTKNQNSSSSEYYEGGKDPQKVHFVDHWVHFAFLTRPGARVLKLNQFCLTSRRRSTFVPSDNVRLNNVFNTVAIESPISKFDKKVT